MTRCYNIVTQLDADIFSEKNYSKADKEYIKKRIEEFEWNSLQRFPNPKEFITFLGPFDFNIKVGEIWAKITKDDDLQYTILFDEIRILEDHR